MGIETPYFLILAGLLIIVGFIAIYSDMLRNVVFDSGTLNSLAQQQGKKDKAGFSLAKTQLAFWSIIVIGSYIYIAFFKPDHGVEFYVKISAVNLTLLGIAAGTTVVSKGIDANQQNNSTPQDAFKQQNLPGKGFFFMDIISDDTGVSIHRLQNVIWTLVVGIIYIAFVNNNCRLPDEDVISNTLLGLMGISSVAYLGVKTQENKSSQPSPVINYNKLNTFTLNQDITPLNSGNTGGAATNFSVNNPLPAGLKLDAITGVISGHPTVSIVSTDYIITATNATGSTSQTINITVK